MKFPFLASFIIFILWFSYNLSKRKSIDEAPIQEFWEKEHRANNTKKQPLDDLEYITIPFEKLPMHILSDDEQVAEYTETLKHLSETPIVNFTGISNTDLKLKYGAPNLDLLSRYDQNYTVLARTLNKWAEYLYKKGYPAESREILEFAVSTRTDISGSYKLLCQIYKEENTPEKIHDLYPIAESIVSATQKTIVHILQESEQ
ncbi:MAG: hypothetical protein J1E98_08775 [Lachnospiraceae bacterium]|nr:hypothetical protein [Lachnospiraceae bacterium]